MNKHRIYDNNDWKAGDRLCLSDDAYNHLVNVLRLKNGDQFTIFNGRGEEGLAIISAQKKRRIEIEIINKKKVSYESHLKIHLGQCLSKGERMDFAIQKAVELGVSEITPIISQRNVVKLEPMRMQKKLNHWQKIIENACCQCGRNVLPLLNEPINLELWLEKQSNIILFLHPKNEKRLQQITIEKKSLSLLIGPEGGFSEYEVAMAVKYSQAISLGPRILRTETAAIAAISALQTLYGDH